MKFLYECNKQYNNKSDKGISKGREFVEYCLLHFSNDGDLYSHGLKAIAGMKNIIGARNFIYFFNAAAALYGWKVLVLLNMCVHAHACVHRPSFNF